MLPSLIQSNSKQRCLSCVGGTAWPVGSSYGHTFASPAALTEVLEERRQRDRMSENVFLMVRRERTDRSE